MNINFDELFSQLFGQVAGLTVEMRDGKKYQLKFEETEAEEEATEGPLMSKLAGLRAEEEAEEVELTGWWVRQEGRGRKVAHYFGEGGLTACGKTFKDQNGSEYVKATDSTPKCPKCLKALEKKDKPAARRGRKAKDSYKQPGEVIESFLPNRTPEQIMKAWEKKLVPIHDPYDEDVQPDDALFIDAAKAAFAGHKGDIMKAIKRLSGIAQKEVETVNVLFYSRYHTVMTVISRTGTDLAVRKMTVGTKEANQALPPADWYINFAQEVVETLHEREAGINIYE